MSTLRDPPRPTFVPAPLPASRPAPSPPPARQSPDLPRREIGLLALAAVALALATSWPLVLHLQSRISPDLGDPVRTAWQIAFTGHALLHHPLSPWDANAFWPLTHSLLFSDSLLGFGPAGMIGSGPVAALVRYNLLYLLAYALAAAGAYLLGRELGLGRPAAALAGVAFAYAPFRATEAGHLHVISSGAIALSVFLLLRGYRRGRPGTAAAGWLVATWQLSLGFTLGLQLAYLLAALALLAGLAWLRCGRPRLSRALVVVTVAGTLSFAAIGAFEGLAYLDLSHDYPSARRTEGQVQRYSAPLRALLAAPVENRVWGQATATARVSLSSENESTFFPGLTTFVLAVVGLIAGVYRRRLRVGLGVGAAVTAVLALGFGLADGRYTYGLLYHHFPGFDAIRTPGRIFTLTSLFLALLAGAGAHRLGALSRRGRRRIAVGVVLIALVLVEGSSRLAHPVVPRLPSAQVGLTGPTLHLPTDSATDRLFQFWSTEGFGDIANGNSTFELPGQDDLRGAMQNFPDALGVDRLRRMGIRTVVLHTDLAPVPLPPLHGAIPEPPDPTAAAVRPIAGLPLTRRRAGPLVIFDLLALPGPLPPGVQGPQGATGAPGASAP